jgi:hypothetical protein
MGIDEGFVAMDFGQGFLLLGFVELGFGVVGGNDLDQYEMQSKVRNAV